MRILDSLKAGSSQIRRVASMPSMSGMRMSITTRSGSWVLASSTASRPVAASPTTAMSGVESSSSRKVARSRD